MQQFQKIQFIQFPFPNLWDALKKFKKPNISRPSEPPFVAPADGLKILGFLSFLKELHSFGKQNFDKFSFLKQLHGFQFYIFLPSSSLLAPFSLLPTPHDLELLNDL